MTPGTALFVHPGLKVRPCALGYGVFTDEPIAQGTVVEECHYLRMPTAEVGRVVGDYVYELSFREGEADPGESWAALPLGFGCIYNHASSPNLGYVRGPREPGAPDVFSFHAARDIVAGEQLTVTYGMTWWRNRGMEPPGDEPAQSRDFPLLPADDDHERALVELLLQWRFHRHRGDLATALREGERALELARERGPSSAALAVYVEAVVQRGQRGEPILELVTEARRTFPDNLRLCWEAARVELAAARPQAARELLGQVVAAAEKSELERLGTNARLVTVDAPRALAQALFDLGAYAEAARWFGAAEQAAGRDEERLELRTKRVLAQARARAVIP